MARSWKWKEKNILNWNFIEADPNCMTHWLYIVSGNRSIGKYFLILLLKVGFSWNERTWKGLDLSACKKAIKIWFCQSERIYSDISFKIWKDTSDQNQRKPILCSLFSPQKMRNMTVDSKKKMAEENSVINLLPRTFAKYKWWFLVCSVPGKEEMLRNLTGETSLGKLLPTGQSNCHVRNKS